VAIIVGGGLYFWMHRPSSAPPELAPIVDKGPKISPEMRYTTARRDLLAGKYDLAAAAFRELVADKKVGEPLHSWSATHEALSELLQGRPAIAQEVLKKMGTEVTPDSSGLDDDLTAFFGKLAKHGASMEATPFSEAAVYKKDTVEALGLLIIGLTNWVRRVGRANTKKSLGITSKTSPISRASLKTFAITQTRQTKRLPP
jgi:hypothetical protein